MAGHHEVLLTNSLKLLLGTRRFMQLHWSAFVCNKLSGSKLYVPSRSAGAL
jgi:hypothetical protein